MKNFGFIADIIQADHYILGDGSVPQVILQPDGQWDSFLPFDKLQALNGIEPMDCSTYGTLNCVEALMQRVFGLKPDYSDRYVAICSGTTEAGNSPQIVAEAIRSQCGLIDDNLLPEGAPINSFFEYYSPNPMTASLLSQGQKWLKAYNLLHDWVFQDDSLSDKQALLMEALTYSPCGVSVHAWIQDPATGLFTKPSGSPDNHWVMCYGYVTGQYWKVFDSYDNTHKQLAWDYDFGFSKRYYVENNYSVNPPSSPASLLIQVLTSIRDSLLKAIHLKS